MLFSIIICTYNDAEKLKKTLDSLAMQSFDDFEVVVIDGKSKDDTVEVLKSFEKRFNGRLKWASEPDAGIYNAMNKGIDLSQGRYLNIVGAGDWLEKDALLSAAQCIEKNPDADAVYGILRMWSKDLEKSDDVQTLPGDLVHTPMQHPALYYRKLLHDKFGLYDESYKIAADYLFCLKAFYVGGSEVVAFDTIVDNYVLDGVSATNEDLCIKENIRARRSLKLIPNRFMRFIYKLCGVQY